MEEMSRNQGDQCKVTATFQKQKAQARVEVGRGDEKQVRFEDIL